MSRITRIVPTTVLTVAALALAAPVAQAKPFFAPSSVTMYVNPSVQSTQDANSGSGGSTYVNPSVQSTQDANYGTHVGSVAVTTGDMPLANPVQLPQNLSAGLMHASTVQSSIDQGSKTPVSVPDSSGNGVDWTAVAIGAGFASILMVMLAAGVGFRRRGQLAA